MESLINYQVARRECKYFCNVCKPYFRAAALRPLVEMKVKVKILQGAECNVDVTHGDSVETLKVRSIGEIVSGIVRRKPHCRSW